MENECQFVSSRGIMKSCKHYNPIMISGNTELPNDFLESYEHYDSVYVCTAALPAFVQNILPKLTKPIVLVTGDSTFAIIRRQTQKNNAITNETWKPIIQSRYIKHWYAQNCTFYHRRITHIPLGLDYHSSGWGVGHTIPVDQETAIKSIIQSSEHFSKREIKCYASYHFTLKRGDRMDAFTKVNKRLVYYEPRRVIRSVSHRNQTRYAFVISPFGKGYDCHRTWEALVLGCIPIVRHSGLDNVFYGLPVLFINDWSEITEELLQSTVAKFKTMYFQYERLDLRFWTSLFR